MEQLTINQNSLRKRVSFKHLGNLLITGVIAIGLIFLGVLGYSLSQVNTLQQSWLSFEHSRSEKIRAASSLHRVLGYGGLIHNYNNLILRHNNRLMLSVQAEWGAAKATIEHYRTLNLTPDEIGALDGIERVINEYRSAANTIRRLVSNGTPSEQIIEKVVVDDQPAINGIAVLDLHNQDILLQLGANSKPILINELRRAMGYGGMIDNFKKYVMRKEQKFKSAAEFSYQQAIEVINRFRSQSLTLNEQQALDSIEATVKEYAAQLPKISELAALGIAAHAIDKTVKVDDTQAIKSFNILNSEVVKAENQRAETMESIFTSVYDLLFIIIITSIVMISLIIFLVARMTKKHLIKPLVSMTDKLTKLASGQLDVNISASSKIQEIDDISSALQIFKNNITERLSAEAALRERQQLLAAIFNTVPDAIITIDNHWVVSNVNDALSQIFGSNIDNLIGKPLTKLLDEQSIDELFGDALDVDSFIAANDQGTWLPATGIREDGSTCPIEFALNPTSTEDSGLYTVVIRDITERHEIEKMKSAFISSVSHELRTPLTSIRGSLGLLEALAQNLSDQDRDMLHVAQRNSERLGNLVNDILTIGKLDSADFELTKAKLDIAKLAKQSIEDLQGFAHEHKVNLELVCPDKPLEYHGDYERLLQVIINLLSNAIKFSDADATVSLTVEAMDHHFKVSVADQGRGIPDEFRSRIFGRFAQADGSDKREQSGTGLGLYISKRIIDLHNGTIDFTSKLGEGTTFFFILPIKSRP